MSDKRFELDRTGIFDNKTNHFYYKIFDDEEVVDLLNSFVGDIKHLEEYCGDLESDVKRFEKENVQLKKERDYWKAKYEERTETFELKWSEERFKIIGLCDNDRAFLDKDTEMVYKTISTRTVELLNLLNEAKESWKEVAEELQEENEELKNQLEQIPPKVKEIWLK